MRKRVVLTLLLTCLSFGFVNAQEEDDETKMKREVVELKMEKPKEAPKPKVEVEHKKGKGKKVHVEAPSEVVIVDSTAAPELVPATPNVIAARAKAWFEKKTKTFTKGLAGATTAKVEGTITVPYKTKELNPTFPVNGTIVLDLVIDVKEGKYRYTIKNARHVATNDAYSGGDVYEKVPKCGSLQMDDLTWKKIKSEAMNAIEKVAEDLKTGMDKDLHKPKVDNW